jgi:uncharacterized protein YbgA (DUF1722 family)
LAGDPVLLDYLRGKNPALAEIREYFRQEEEAWIRKTQRFRLYEDPLYSGASL